jgi:hypothetical protein
VRGRVREPYIYKIKIKKNNIPIGLQLQEQTEREKYRKRNRVTGCKLRFWVPPKAQPATFIENHF